MSASGRENVSSKGVWSQRPALAILALHDSCTVSAAELQAESDAQVSAALPVHIVYSFLPWVRSVFVFSFGWGSDL